MPNSALRKIFWGYALTMFDFSINEFDLLPDIVGYLLIVYGLSKLSRYDQLFRLASILAILQLILAAGMGPSLNLQPLPLWQNLPEYDFRAMLETHRDWLESLLLLVDIVLVWTIGSGIARLARRAEDEELRSTIIFRRNSYLVLSMPLLGLLLLPLLGLHGLLLIGVIPLLLLSGLVLLAMLHKAAGAASLAQFKPLTLPEEQGSRPITPATRLIWLIGLATLVSAILWAAFWNRPHEAALLHSFPGQSGAGRLGSSATFSPDGRFVALLANRFTLEIRSASSGELIRTMVSEGSLDDVAYSPDGRYLVTAGLRTSIWDAETGEELKRIPDGPMDPNDLSGNSQRVSFSPDGSQVLVCNYAAIVYDSTSGRHELTITTIDEERSGAVSVNYSPDGSRIVTGDQDGKAQVWEAATGKLLLTLASQGHMVSDVAYSPDGKLIATANDHNLVTIWDAQTGTIVRRFAISTLLDHLLGRRPHAYPRNWTASVAFSADGRLLAAGSSDASAGVWDVATGRQLFALTGHEDDVKSISFSPDGSQVLSASADRTVRLWDISDAAAR